MMTKKTLAKAVTLSVLLMLPYGMAWAAEYDATISGKDDTYGADIKNYDVEKGAYVYDFNNETTIKKETNTGYYGINAKGSDIIINNKLNIEITQGYYGSSASAGSVFGIYAYHGCTVDRRFGGDITLYGDDKGGIGVYVAENGKLLLGDGNITITRKATKNAYFSDMPVGIDFSGGNGAIAAKGSGTIKVTDETDNNYNYSQPAGAYGIAFDYGDAGNTLILGYNGDYSDSDLAKFQKDNLKDIVANETLEKVDIITEAKAATDYAESAGISWNQAFQSDVDGSNVIAAGKLNITAKATSNMKISDEELNYPGAETYKYNEISSASGIVNSQQWSQDEDEEEYKDVDTNIIAKSVDIDAEATNNGNLFVGAYGINSNSKIENISATTTLLEASEIDATATGNGKVKANGILAEGNGLVMKYRLDNYLPVYYLEYKNGGNVEVNTSDITITTTTNGGKEVENVGIKASGADVNVNGTANITAIANDLEDEENNKVYGLWSTFGGNITINGKTTISTTGGQDIAVVAGTENWTDVTAEPDGGTNNINLNYGAGSEITGDIISGYGGNITIGDADGISTLSTRNNAGTLKLTGDALSANGGKLSINYQNADLKEQVESKFFNPKFSHDIAASGTVNVNLAEGATWDVTGQSWLTKLEGTGGVIDMRNGGAYDTSHAVHIGDLEGSHTFVMDLDTEHSVSDMLFIKGNAGGEQKLWINSINGLENLKDGDSLRFATVNSAGLTFSGDYNFGSYENAKNGIMLADNGVMNNAFVIKSEKYDVNDSKKENEGYNGGTEFDEVKPGDKYVDKNYAGATNWLLAKDSSGDKVSDAGKTIINMSKVNYNNAIYMDRLNKRLGEARYISPEDEQGMWVRIRHDRIGKDDAFRSQNTMYEMGYDVKQDCGNGERRVGMAIDYMDGKAEYTGIAGDGDVKRYGLWLYDTWLGDKGHYTDYVLKWGHLENDFDIMARTTGEKITGDYSNNVFSASAEYGKKNDMGGGWYFEPQAQLQFARVTGADYVTSQDTKVSLDGINSLIGRAGFRLGRDLNENSTVYVKADLLHEFLGDQDITATDITGTLREEYENEGTWYDVGFGFATALSNNSYAFMDFEKSFGNDNDETYQINAGVQWTF